MFDPDELVRWAETYGHPEEWAKRAQDAHARAERLDAKVADLSEALRKHHGYDGDCPVCYVPSDEWRDQADRFLDSQGR